METLPPEIVANILSRLPVEPLFKAKYVCKLWNSTIKNPSFTTAHFSRAKPTLLLHFPRLYVEHTYNKTPSDLFLLDPTDPEPHLLPLRSAFHLSDLEYTVVGSTHGVLCLTLPSDDPELPFYLFNPVLNEYLTIPPNPDWEPSGFKSFSGFAHDSVSGAFKLVRLSVTDEGEPFELLFNIFNGEGPLGVVCACEVCTVDPAGVVGPWRDVGDAPLQPEIPHGVLLDGKLHWVASEHDSDDRTPSVMAFDVQCEVFHVFPVIPGSPTDGRWWFELGVVDGCLALFDFCCPRSLDVWVMKEYGKEESWVKVHAIKRRVSDWYRNGDMYAPQSLLDDGRLLMVHRGRDVVAYVPESGVIEDYKGLSKVCEELGTTFNSMVGVPHTCTIVSLKGSQQVRDDNFGTPGGWDTALHPWRSHERVSPPQNVFTVTPEMQMLDVEEFEDEDD